MNKLTRFLLIAFSILATTASVHAARADWTQDFAQAMAQAKSENKVVLLNFTGSDWCHWCIKLEDEIFRKRAFVKYAKENLVLMKVDFPHNRKLSNELARQNLALMKRYEEVFHGFPTVIVLSPNGEYLGKLGYMRGGPPEFLAKLRTMTQRRGADS